MLYGADITVSVPADPFVCILLSEYNDGGGNKKRVGADVCNLDTLSARSCADGDGDPVRVSYTSDLLALRQNRNYRYEASRFVAADLHKIYFDPERSAKNDAYRETLHRRKENAKIWISATDICGMINMAAKVMHNKTPQEKNCKIESKDLYRMQDEIKFLLRETLLLFALPSLARIENSRSFSNLRPWIIHGDLTFDQLEL